MVLVLAGCGDNGLRGAVPGGPGGKGDTIIIPQQSNSGQGAPGTWAFYWYMCGADLESQNACATIDLQEMLQVPLPEGVQVVIETGGAKAWQNEVMSANSLGRYLYSGNMLEFLEEKPDASMGDPGTLVDFLRFCNQNFPAEHQVVTFWDHGGGSLAGVIFDEKHNNDSLSIPELKTAFAAAPAASGAYELVGFDACLMATVDIAATIRPYARYMVASEESEPGCGWEYTGLFSALARDTSMNGAALGRAICDTFYAGCEAVGVQEMTTLSVIDLSRAGALLDAYNALGDEALLGGVRGAQAFISSFGNAARNAENYGGNNDASGYFDMVDLSDLVKKAGPELLPGNSAKVLSALEDCVLYQVKGASRSGAGGLACYYCYDGSEGGLRLFQAVADSPGFKYFYEYALTGRLSDEGAAYIKTIPEASGEAVQTLPPPSGAGLDGAAVSLSADGHYQVDVGAAGAKNIAFVSLDVLFCAAVDPKEIYNVYDLGSSRLVDVSRAADGRYTDAFDGKWAAVRDKDYEAYEYTHIEVIDRKPGEYTIYEAPVMVTTAVDGNFDTDVPMSWLLLKYIEAEGRYDILGVRSGASVAAGQTGPAGVGDSPGQEAEAADLRMAGKDLRQLAPGEYILPVNRMAWPEGDTWTPLHFIDPLPEPPEDTGFVFPAENALYYDEVFIDGFYRIRFDMVDYTGSHHLSAPGWYRFDEAAGGLVPVKASDVNMPNIRE